ncbi:uncharacterized membrane protein YebE (DUF533 family) [Rhodovulum imhoffii]|uniref:Uncharacterized membrane protein YebE (DUF533 family) n=1 Tax=Rhodovulum imhoffii TaxID=365340 RepID=A0A2T5BW73_9RHOB|nr:DUF533 domain-containing protein [Rhodovulum imhoffii]MBK5935184.1 hypothetical protein [Rhodovulum imhoffii]PTN03848.1 uncharacterized membrane protein YebE (DUF533 family) [Rhodovulum imhoffii]
MSFVKTLATLAVGFAATKGVQKFQQMGGMAGMKQAMQSGGMMDQLGGMMSKMGVSGGAGGLQGLMGQLGGPASNAGAAGMAGLGGLMAAMGGAAAAGSGQVAGLFDALTGTTAATSTMEDNAKLMIRAMIMAARADGEIDAEEQANIMQHLGDVSEEERAFVQQQMAAPVDPYALAADAGEQMAAQVYATSVMAVRVDNVAEAQYLDTLAAALGLSPEARERIHAAMGLSGSA